MLSLGLFFQASCHNSNVLISVLSEFVDFGALAIDHLINDNFFFISFEIQVCEVLLHASWKERVFSFGVLVPYSFTFTCCSRSPALPNNCVKGKRQELKLPGGRSVLRIVGRVGVPVCWLGGNSAIGAEHRYSGRFLLKEKEGLL